MFLGKIKVLYIWRVLAFLYWWVSRTFYDSDQKVRAYGSRGILFGTNISPHNNSSGLTRGLCLEHNATIVTRVKAPGANNSNKFRTKFLPESLAHATMTWCWVSGNSCCWTKYRYICYGCDGDPCLTVVAVPSACVFRDRVWKFVCGNYWRLIFIMCSTVFSNYLKRPFSLSDPQLRRAFARSNKLIFIPFLLQYFIPVNKCYLTSLISW